MSIDKNLVSLIKNNPEKGIRECMNRYSGPVNTICRNFLTEMSVEDVEEAVADTFFKLWKNIKQFDIERGSSLKSYLFEIARNTAIDKRRKAKLPDMFPIDEVTLEADYSVEAEMEKREKERILHEALKEYKEPDRTVFILRYFYGEKIKEIAALLSLDAKNVENILFRGKERLKEMLVRKGVDYSENR
jgi:RNA polymerase sigma-70 factor (ECF subfamily)